MRGSAELYRGHNFTKQNILEVCKETACFWMDLKTTNNAAK